MSPILVATGCMIAGSSRGPRTPHGLLGFSSLAAMLAETGMAWRHRLREGERLVPLWLHRYSRLTYAWRVIAYIRCDAGDLQPGVARWRDDVSGPP